MTFIIIAIIVYCVYRFIKSNTQRGAELVRAHIYLGGIGSGATVAEANYVAGSDVSDGPTEIIHGAMAHLQREYAGEQISMIADAYRQGMHPKLPSWYRTITGLS